MARVYLGLGSNIDPEQNLAFGVAELRRRYGDLDVSNVYRNEALGFDGPDFLNLVVGLDAVDAPADIHMVIREIHEGAGRVPEAERFSSRPLDIDLLLYGDLIVDEPPVRLPRADVLEYSFVLRPLAELAPDLVHPTTRRTMLEHWLEFDQDCHPLTPERVIL